METAGAGALEPAARPMLALKIVALLGANGAGKSTTLKSVSTLLASERGEVTKGSIEFRSKRTEALSPGEMVGMGMVQVMESLLLAEQNTNVALKYANCGCILESGRIMMDSPAKALAENADVKEFYLGLSKEGRKSFRDMKSYRRRKRCFRRAQLNSARWRVMASATTAFSPAPASASTCARNSRRMRGSQNFFKCMAMPSSASSRSGMATKKSPI